MDGALPRWRLFVLFALVSLATRGPFLGFAILNGDEAAHAVGSWELMDGGRLYVDYADHKPPLIYLYYALAQALLGRGMLAVRLLTTLVALPMTALAASAFYRHDRRGLFAGLLYLLYGAAFLASDMQAVNGEVLMLLPAAWALAVTRDAGAAARPLPVAASGVLIALATLFKPQAAFWGPAIAWAAWRAAAARGARAASLAALASGFALPLLATAAVFWNAGTLGEFLYWNVTHNLRYTGSGLGAIDALGRAARFLLPFLLVTTPLWWGAWRSRSALDPHQRRLLAGVLLVSLPAVVLGLRFFPHYFIQLYLPLALMAAPHAVELSARRPRSRPARLALAWTAAMVLGFTVANLYVLTRTDAIESARPVFGRVAQRLRADPCFDGARLFVWGFAPELYYHSRLRPASRFVVPAYTVSGYEPGHPDARAAERLIREDHWALLISDLERSRATYVLDTAGSGLHRWRPFPVHRFPHLLALLRREFVLLDTVDGVAIYRRIGCAPRGAPAP
jgi:4-amino-4-deoxy-L-arabinose transferase-like glycosyltransferase